MDGAVIQMINHGLTTGALFACVGVIYERYHTREMAELGGLWDRLPLLAFFFILASLGSAALPGLNGFVGEFPILVGMFARSPRAAVLAGLGHDPGRLLPALDAPARPLRPAPRAPRPPRGRRATAEAGHAGASHEAAVRPVGWHEIAGLTPLMVLIVVIGVFPGPFFDRIRPSVAPIAARVERVEAAPADRPGAARPGPRPSPPRVSSTPPARADADAHRCPRRRPGRPC